MEKNHYSYGYEDPRSKPGGDLRADGDFRNLIPSISVTFSHWGLYSHRPNDFLYARMRQIQSYSLTHLPEETGRNHNLAPLQTATSGELCAKARCKPRGFAGLRMPCAHSPPRAGKPASELKSQQNGCPEPASRGPCFLTPRIPHAGVSPPRDNHLKAAAPPPQVGNHPSFPHASGCSWGSFASSRFNLEIRDGITDDGRGAKGGRTDYPGRLKFFSDYR